MNTDMSDYDPMEVDYPIEDLPEGISRKRKLRSAEEATAKSFLHIGCKDDLAAPAAKRTAIEVSATAQPQQSVWFLSPKEVKTADQAFMFWQHDRRNTRKQKRLVSSIEQLTDEHLVELFPQHAYSEARSPKGLFLHYLKGCPASGCANLLSVKTVAPRRHQNLLACDFAQLQAAKQTYCLEHRASECRSFIERQLGLVNDVFVSLSELFRISSVSEVPFSKSELLNYAPQLIDIAIQTVGGETYLCHRERDEEKMSKQLQQLVTRTSSHAVSTKTTVKDAAMPSQKKENDELIPQRILTFVDLFEDVLPGIIQTLGAADISSLSRSCRFGRKMVRKAFTGRVVIRIGPDYSNAYEGQDLSILEQEYPLPLTEGQKQALARAQERKDELDRVDSVYDCMYSRRRMLISAGGSLRGAKNLNIDEFEAAEKLNQIISSIDIIFRPDGDGKSGKGLKLSRLWETFSRLEDWELLGRIQSIEIDCRYCDPLSESPEPSPNNSASSSSSFEEDNDVDDPMEQDNKAGHSPSESVESEFDEEHFHCFYGHLDSDEERKIVIKNPKGFQYTITEPDFYYEGAPVYLALQRKCLKDSNALNVDLAFYLTQLPNLRKLNLKGLLIEKDALEELKKLRLTDLVLEERLAFDLEGLADVNTVLEAFKEMASIKRLEFSRLEKPLEYVPLVDNLLSEKIDLLELLKTSWPQLEVLSVTNGLIKRSNHALVDIASWKCFSSLRVLQMRNTRLPEVEVAGLAASDLKWMDLQHTRQSVAWQHKLRNNLLEAAKKKDPKTVAIVGDGRLRLKDRMFLY